MTGVDKEIQIQDLYAEISYHRRQIERIEVEKQKLDADFKIIKECQYDLAKCMSFYMNIKDSCDDINSVFGNSSIKDDYNRYNITFDKQEETFENLDNIVNATNRFYTGTEEGTKQLNPVAETLDTEAAKIGTEAKELQTKIKIEQNYIRSCESKIGALQDGI